MSHRIALLPVSIGPRVARAVAVITVAACGGSPAQGQQIVATAFGKHQFESFGEAVAYGPDLDGDGFGEIAVGAPGNLAYAGSAFVLSGRTLSRIVRLDGKNHDGLGVSVCWCGDLDGDGLSDLAAGAYQVSVGPGLVRIYSSSNWALIRTLAIGGTGWFGFSVVDAGDVNGDGIDDQLVAAPRTDSSIEGEVALFSGKDGSLLRTFKGSPGDMMGWSIAAIGDTNGDGTPDLLLGSPGADATTFNDNAGAVDLVSGADGSLLWRRYGNWTTYYDSYFQLQYEGDNLPYALAPAGDVNNDGIPDVVASPSNGVVNRYVTILSGVDGSDLRTFDPQGGSMTRALTSLADYDGDGLPEIACGVADFVAIYSSRDGKILWRTDAVGATGVSSVARTADVDGDGRDDFILGIQDDSTMAAGGGRAELRTANDLWLDISPNHAPGINEPMIFRANEGPPGNPAALFLTGVNGTPFFSFLFSATFDATGSALLVRGSAPSGFTGTQVELRALAIDGNLRLVQSADETIILP